MLPLPLITLGDKAKNRIAWTAFSIKKKVQLNSISTAEWAKKGEQNQI